MDHNPASTGVYNFQIITMIQAIAAGRWLLKGKTKRTALVTKPIYYYAFNRDRPCSKAIVFKVLLAIIKSSFAISSCCNYNQNRIQYDPLKSACINKVYLVLLNIISYWQRQLSVCIRFGYGGGEAAGLGIKIYKKIPIPIIISTSACIRFGFFFWISTRFGFAYPFRTY